MNSATHSTQRARRTTPRVLASCLAVAIAAGCAAQAAGAEDHLVPALIRTCTTVKKNSERLACYDQAIERLSAGQTDVASTPPSAESMFGVAASDSRPQGTAKPVEREELASVTARVSSLRSTAEGYQLIELDNGQTWRQTGGGTTLLLKTGDEVTIIRGALNSFRLSTPSGRVVKVNRVR